MGAVAYYVQETALAGGHLNLGAWFGYQEVSLRDKVDARGLSLRFKLLPYSYFSVI